MKEQKMTTKFFLDSGDPAETRRAVELLGVLHGQTTNPTLVAKHPEVQRRFAAGEHFTTDELMHQYKLIVQEVRTALPEGSISIEVYADAYTSEEDMFDQAQQMYTWIPGAHIKFPTTAAGLAAAALCVKEDIPVNMTLCFTQQQAAAVYAATRGAEKGEVFVSPFIGRLDDIGINGMDLIQNCVKMFAGSDGHVEVLAASIRSSEHMAAAIAAGADIVTAPLSVYEEWVAAGKPVEAAEASGGQEALAPILYEAISLDNTESGWDDFDIHHQLTDAGIERFANDWNQLITEDEVPQKENE